QTEAAQVVDASSQEHADGRAMTRYERTDVPGVYHVQSGAERISFAVSTDPDESDLRRASEFALRRRLGTDFTLIRDADELKRRLAAAPRVELSRSLFGMLFLMLLGETLFAAIFGHRR
ncbi:MAG: hypothetical protein V3T70_11020, partial [Phycisphaerae bacterium]